MAKTRKQTMLEGIGIDHLYLAVSDPARSADFYDRVPIDTPEFRKSASRWAARRHPEYTADSWATYFSDPDGIRLEIVNYRRERR